MIRIKGISANISDKQTFLRKFGHNKSGDQSIEILRKKLFHRSSFNFFRFILEKEFSNKSSANIVNIHKEKKT